MGDATPRPAGRILRGTRPLPWCSNKGVPRTSVAQKTPAFLFYPGDWLKDPELQSCSLAARGAWIDIVCLMSQCKPFGMLATDGDPWDEERLARALRGCDNSVTGAIEELKSSGVLKQNSRGFFYSKRLVEIERERKKWVKRQKTHRLAKSARHADVTPLSRPSSSSSSSSVSSSKEQATPSAETALFFVAPLADWIPVETWAEYQKMRGRIRRPMTPHAVDLAIRKLAELRSDGENIQAVLEQSILNSWAGLFPVKEASNGKTSGNRRDAEHQAKLAATDRAAENFLKRAERVAADMGKVLPTKASAH